MEDTNRDSHDSETSSTSSWILLEATDENNVENLRIEEVQRNHSDIESDDISIISESEISQSDEDGEENTSPAEEFHDDQETTLITEIEEAVEIGEEVEIENENNENEEEVENIQALELKEDDFDTTGTLVEVDNYDYQKFITWPSLICTSVVIFAVLIFPYFSSDVDDSNYLNQKNNLDQYDLNVLKDTKLTDIDPYIYCKEIYKTPGFRRDNNNMKKCIKKVSKLIKKAKKNQLDKEVNFVEREIDKETIDNKNIKKRNGKSSKYKDNEEFCDENERSCEYSKKNSNIIDQDKENSQFFYHTKIIGKNSPNRQKFETPNDENTDLEKTRILLEKKESMLKEWEMKLIQKEKMIRSEQEKLEREKKRKGDFDDGPNYKKFKKYVHFNNYPEEYEKNAVKKLPVKKPNPRENGNKFFTIRNLLKKNKTKILDDDNVTATGEWYLNLVQGRHDTRKKEEKASWWFDRAEYRKNKRNKAYWYFQYMFNRENLRYRPKNK